MSSFPRMMSVLAAALGVAAVLWITPPAMAAESNPTGKQAAGVANVRTASAVGKHHALGRTVSARTPRIRYADAASGWLQCTNSWCGRPFVLIIGVGF